MCGRYHIDKETAEDIERLVDEIDGRLAGLNYGDINPSDDAPILTAEGDSLRASVMKWGFPTEDRKLLINARAETAVLKRTFAESVLERRCIIPAGSFYEWDHSRNKVEFTLPRKDSLYMAGFYKYFDGVARFIILTTAANSSMSPIHDRMPLIFSEEELRPWLNERLRTAEFLKQASPILRTYRPFEQLSFF